LKHILFRDTDSQYMDKHDIVTYSIYIWIGNKHDN